VADPEIIGRGVMYPVSTVHAVSYLSPPPQFHGTWYLVSGKRARCSK